MHRLTVGSWVLLGFVLEFMIALLFPLEESGFEILEDYNYVVSGNLFVYFIERGICATLVTQMVGVMV